MAAPLLRTEKATRCSLHHGPITDCPPPVCPTGGIEVVPSEDGPITYACTCPVCTEQGAVA